MLMRRLKFVDAQLRSLEIERKDERFAKKKKKRQKKKVKVWVAHDGEYVKMCAVCCCQTRKKPSVPRKKSVKMKRRSVCEEFV